MEYSSGWSLHPHTLFLPLFVLFRFVVRHSLRMLNRDGTSLEELLTDHVSSLKKLLFPKLIRILPLPNQCAVIEACAFILNRAPKLIPITDKVSSSCWFYERLSSWVGSRRTVFFRAHDMLFFGRGILGRVSSVGGISAVTHSSNWTSLLHYRVFLVSLRSYSRWFP